jgi:methionyl aminopeptidase
VLRSKIQQAPELKSIREIGLMRETGKLVAEALRICREMAKPGVRTIEIEKEVEALFAKHGAIPLFKNYSPDPKFPPYPACTCISINEQVVHGIPGSRVIKEGDLISFDTACKLNGWCADRAITVAVGNVRPERMRLLKVAEETLAIAIEDLGKKRWWSEVASRMERHVKQAGFSVVEDYVGHGIGRKMHESPQVPNYVNAEMKKKGDFRLEPGLVLAIEPMVNMMKGSVDTLHDKWTVVTKDGLPSVHVEHTLAILPGGKVEIVTRDGD